MVYFTEKLIHEIRMRSCIWDTADVNHLNKEVLTNMWTEIAENLYSDWHSLSAFDQRDRVSDVKKKWTNIKDSFVKDVKGKKPRKSRGPPEHRKKYYLFDHLQFLIPFIQDGKSSTRAAEDGSAGGEPVKKRTRKLQQQHGEGTSSSLRAEIGGGSSSAYGGPIKTDASPDVQKHADLMANFAGKSAADSLCQLDGDLSFMVSLMPTVKSMNEIQKINFKIGILQLLARIKYNEVLLHQDPSLQQHQQPFVPATTCFPYQPAVAAVNQHHAPSPFPFVNQTAVSSTQKQRQQADMNATATTIMKEETIEESSPSSSRIEDDCADDDGGGGDNDDDNDDDYDGARRSYCSTVRPLPHATALYDTEDSSSP